MKKIIFFIFLLLPSFGFSSSSWQDWRNWASRGMSNMYNYRPNLSQYVPDTPIWISTLLKKLSNSQMRALYFALAKALGINSDKPVQNQELTQKIKDAARQRYGFTEVDYSLDGNANNLMLFIAIASGLNVENKNDRSAKYLTSYENLFKTYVYPVLKDHAHVEKYIKSENNDIIITDRINNQNTWNSFIDQIKKHAKFNEGPIKTIQKTMKPKNCLIALKKYFSTPQDDNNQAKKLLTSLDDAIKFNPSIPNPRIETEQNKLFIQRPGNKAEIAAAVKELPAININPAVPPVFGQLGQ